MGTVARARARDHDCAEPVLHRDFHATDAGGKFRVRVLSAGARADRDSADKRHASHRRRHAAASGNFAARRRAGAGIAGARPLYPERPARRQCRVVAGARRWRRAGAALHGIARCGGNVRLLAQESVIVSGERPLTYVPRAVWLALLAALILHIAWQ